MLGHLRQYKKMLKIEVEGRVSSLLTGFIADGLPIPLLSGKIINYDDKKSFFYIYTLNELLSSLG